MRKNSLSLVALWLPYLKVWILGTVNKKMVMTVMTNTSGLNTLAKHIPSGQLGQAYIDSLSPFLSPGHKLTNNFVLNISNTFKIDVSLPILNTLDAAHMNGWASYSCYDSVIDTSETSLIPTATTALRISLDFFMTAATALGVPHSVIHKCYETMDKASFWEVTHARSPPNTRPDHLPNYYDLSQLAERSWGCSLAMQLLLHNDNRLRPALQFMHNYLIVRQLFDDIKDWQDDYANGHLSYVVTKILRLANPDANDIASLQKVFLFEALPRILASCKRFLIDSDTALLMIGSSYNGLFKIWQSDARTQLANVEESLHSIKGLARKVQSI